MGGTDRWSPMLSTTCDVPLTRSNPAVRRFSLSDSSKALCSSQKRKYKENGKGKRGKRGQPSHFLARDAVFSPFQFLFRF